MKKLLGQTWLLSRQQLHLEFHNSERWLAPWLFSASLILLGAFAYGEVPDQVAQTVVLAQTYVTLFLTLQLNFSRNLDWEREDQIFLMLRASPLSRTAWFLAKYAVILVMGSLVLVPTFALAAFFYQGLPISILRWDLLGIALLALAGLGALGVLVTTMLLGSGARQMLYPILYFPLSTPVLLAAVESSRAVSAGDTANVNSWLALLGVFAIVYVTLGALLFGELADAA